MSFLEIVLFSLLTFASSFAIIKHSGKLRNEGVKSVMKSQSIIHTKIRPYAPKKNINKEQNSQSKNYVSERMIRIVVVENKAYWMKDSKFFTANMIDGGIDHNTVEEVNTMNMSKEELEKMIFVVDSLKDDKE